VVYLTPKTIADEIRAKNACAGTIIGVDGFMGSGKTTLSFELAELLAGIRVGIDCYVDTGVDATTYVEKLRLINLARDLTKLCAVFPFVILEGICLRNVLERMQLEAGDMVYVKRLSKVGIWHDGLDLEECKFAVEVPTDWLRKNELTYHASCYPHESADFIYQRVEA